MIDDPDQARRLANALCADLLLYQRQAVDGLAPAERARVLAAPVREAYELFLSRVAERHRGLFEEAVAALHAELGAPYHGVPSVPVPAPMGHPPVPGRERGPGGAAPMLIALGVAAIVLVAGLAFFLTVP